MLKTLSALAIALTGSLLGPNTVSTELKNGTIDQIEKSMQERYVFPEVAEKAAKTLRVYQRLGKYESITEGSEFARVLTQHLNEVCKDAHLRVRYSEAVLPIRQNRNAPSKQEIEQMEKQKRLANVGFEKVERLMGNIGYLKFNYFDDGEGMARPVKAAFDFLAETDALIIDVRDNGGGSPDGVRHICSYLFSEKPVHLNDLYFREGNTTEEFWTLKTVPGKRYLNKDVYVLVSKRTGSGAEEFSYNLKNLKRATLLGENTWGGANPGGTVRLNDHFQIFIPVGRAINPYTKTNWEGTGVDPDVRVDPKDALNRAQVMAVEKLLAAAKDEDDKKRLTEVLTLLKKPAEPTGSKG